MDPVLGAAVLGCCVLKYKTKAKWKFKRWGGLETKWFNKSCTVCTTIAFIVLLCINSIANVKKRRISDWNILVFMVLSNVSDFQAIWCRHNFTTDRKWSRTKIPTNHLFQFPQTALELIYCCLLSQLWLTDRRHVLFWNVSGCTYIVKTC